jgi:Leucine-rich repeat (LRR) protein
MKKHHFLEMNYNNGVEAGLRQMPRTMTKIYLSGQNLESLPDLSKFTLLEELYCANNRLKSLPSNLFEMFPKLRLLACSNNYLTSLPPLGEYLEELYCVNNSLTCLPTLPETLKYLYCSLNKIEKLPPLPPYLVDLYCIENQLTKLPALPETLKKLYCGNNQLTYLPKLVNGLQVLSCFNNQIMSLPKMPVHLIELICYRNHLTSLPSLGTDIEVINFLNNPIYEVANWEEYDEDEFYDVDGVNYYKKYMILYTIETINKIRKTYYFKKFKNKLRDFLWVKIREPRIREKYAPHNILKLLNEIGEDSEKFDSLFENL